MKKIYLLLMAVVALSVFTACSKEEPFSTATADDFPRILDPIFPNFENGDPGTMAMFDRTVEYSIKVTVTPADFTQCTWYIDGEQVATGTEFVKTFDAGKYLLKVVATNDVGETYRTAYLSVKPLDGEPQTDPDANYLGAPSCDVTVDKGQNLEKVVAVIVNGIEVAVRNAQYDSFTFTVPDGLAEGSYRMLLKDAAGNTYGGNLLKVTADALITGGFERVTVGAEWHMTGMNLDQVASLSVGETTVTNFKSQTANTLVLECPNVEVGPHALSGTMKNGNKVKFFTGGVMWDGVTVTVTKETTLWEGYHMVSWEKPDGDPNKVFSGVQQEMKSVGVGTKVRVYYDIVEATYHQIQLNSGWWNEIPGYQKRDVSEPGVYEFVMNKAILDHLNAQDGFLVCGHGIAVTRVTIE